MGVEVNISITPLGRNQESMTVTKWILAAAAVVVVSLGYVVGEMLGVAERIIERRRQKP